MHAVRLLTVLCLTNGAAAYAQCGGALTPITFEEVPPGQPTAFVAAAPLVGGYFETGVTFEGPNAMDGGVILDIQQQPVSGLSSPHALAFDKNATTTDGAEPEGPQRLVFESPVTELRFLAAGLGDDTLLTATAFDPGGAVDSFVNRVLDSEAQAITLSGTSIGSVLIESDADTWFIDDICLTGNPRPETCGNEAEVSQAPFPNEDDAWVPSPSGTSQLTLSLELASGTGPISALSIWGVNFVDGTGADCLPSERTFEVLLRGDAGGTPGNVISRLGPEVFRVTRTATGQTFTRNGIALREYRYDFAFNGIFGTGAGTWVGIYATDDSPCLFQWSTSPNGDGVSGTTLVDGTSFVQRDQDLALCLGDLRACAQTVHSADQNRDGAFALGELLRVIQFFNVGGFGCQSNSEDGYAPGDPDQICCPHDSDYGAQDWQINLSELLRLIQFFNSGGYRYCPADGTEDGYCVGS